MLITIPTRIIHGKSDNSGITLGTFKHGPLYTEWMKQAAKQDKNTKKSHQVKDN